MVAWCCSETYDQVFPFLVFLVFFVVVETGLELIEECHHLFVLFTCIGTMDFVNQECDP